MDVGGLDRAYGGGGLTRVDADDQLTAAYGRAFGRKILDFNFADGSGVLPAGIDFTRATPASMFDNFGKLITLGSGVARVDSHVFDGINWINRGLLPEELRANICLESEAFEVSPWAVNGTPVITTNSTIAPDGTMTADTIEDDSGVSHEDVRQTITILDDSASWTFSVYIRKDSDTSRFPEIQLDFTGGTPIQFAVQINTSTGATIVRTGPGSVSSQDAGDYWRFIFTQANNSTGNTAVQMRVLPARTTVFGGVEPAATGSAIFWGYQVEEGAFATSYMKTTTATVTRAADDPTMAVSNIKGFNDSESTLFVEFDQFGNTVIAGNSTQAVEMGDGTFNERIMIRTSLVVVTGGVLQVNIVGSDPLNAGVTKRIGAYRANDFAYVEDGTLIGTDSAGATATSTTMFIGRSGPQNIVLNGHIARIKLWNGQLPNEELQEETS